MCGEIFEGEFPPVPCPVCGAGKEEFIEVTEDTAVKEISKHETYVIVGNGAAGYYSAATIRKNNKAAIIKIVSAENDLSYYRPQLSEYISEDLETNKFYISPKSWYEDNNIELLLGKKAIKTDAENKKLIFEDGESLSYDKLILACGSYNFIPDVKGSDLKGVYTLKFKSDADLIKAAIKSAKNAVVIGGGLLGLEAAWEMKVAGLNISVVEFFPRLLPRQLDDEGAEIFKNIADNSGVKLVLGDSAEEILSDENGSVKGLKLKSGKIIDADLVLFSVGIRANTSLAKDSGIACNRGILVNEKMETSAKDVFACGDVVEIDGKSFGTWPAAMEMGKIAGQNALGDSSAKLEHLVSSVMFRAMNADIFSAGDINFNDTSLKEYTFKAPEKGVYKKLYFKDGVIAGAILIGDTKKAAKVIGALKKNAGENIAEEVLA